MSTGTAQTPEVTAVVEQITPLVAQEYLKANRPGNRVPRYKDVCTIRMDMIAGDFAMTGEAIQFDTNGHLMNGQHRLMALAGIEDVSFTVPILVVRNVPAEAFDRMDNPRIRSISQILQMAGTPYATLKASIGRMLYVMDNFGPQNLKGGMISSKIQVKRFILENNELMQRASIVAESCRDLVMQSVAGTAFCLFYRQSGANAEEFFERLRTGLNLTETDAIWQLRQRLIANRARRGKLAQIDLLALFIMAWKAYMQGRPVKKLYWKDGDPFPTL